jgi:hypothetical protein
MQSSFVETPGDSWQFSVQPFVAYATKDCVAQDADSRALIPVAWRF